MTRVPSSSPAPDSTIVAASSVSFATGRPCATRARSASISRAVWYRSAGSFASARSTTESSSCGTSPSPGGRLVDGGAGTEFRCFMAISSAVSPVKGTVPVSIS